MARPRINCPKNLSTNGSLREAQAPLLPQDDFTGFWALGLAGPVLGAGLGVDGRKGVHLVAPHEHSCLPPNRGPPHNCLFPTSYGEVTKQPPDSGPHTLMVLCLCCCLWGSRFWCNFQWEVGQWAQGILGRRALKSWWPRCEGRKKSCSGEPSAQVHLLWLLQSLSCLLNKGWQSVLSVSPGPLGAPLFLTSSHLSPSYTFSPLVRRSAEQSHLGGPSTCFPP